VGCLVLRAGIAHRDPISEGDHLLVSIVNVERQLDARCRADVLDASGRLKTQLMRGSLLKLVSIRWGMRSARAAAQIIPSRLQSGDDSEMRYPLH